MKTAEKNREYEKWIEDWSVDLYRFAYRLCGRREIAEDLVQETFYHAWRSIQSLRDTSRARSWLFQILRFRYSHWVRADTRRPNLTGPTEAADESPSPQAESTLENMARREWLQRALDELDERYRLPVLMVFMEGLTCREVAEELEIPLGTVLSRIHRARQALKKTLKETDGETAAETEQRLRLGGEAS